MRKFSSFLLLFFLLFLQHVIAKPVTTYQGEEEVKVKITFTNMVTTKNLNEKLNGIPYKLKHGKARIHLSYCDETIENKVAALSFTNLAKLEMDYMALLKQYNLETDFERIGATGVPLEEITILTQKKNLNQIGSSFAIIKIV